MKTLSLGWLHYDYCEIRYYYVMDSRKSTEVTVRPCNRLFKNFNHYLQFHVDLLNIRYGLWLCYENHIKLFVFSYIMIIVTIMFHSLC